MSVAAYPSWPIRFEYGATVYVFPTHAMEWETEQNLRVATADAPLGSYGIDLAGGGPVGRAIATERISYIVLEDNAVALEQHLNELRAMIARAPLGKLWKRDATNQQFWAYARPAKMPSVTYGVQQMRHMPVTLEFVRLSDWYSASAHQFTWIVTANGATTNIQQLGTIPSTMLEIIISPYGTSSPYATQPVLENAATGERVRWAITLNNSNHRLHIDASRFRVRKSTDGGATWTSAWQEIELGPVQATLFTLRPGSNTFIVTHNGGSISLMIEFIWHDAYA